MWWKVQNGGGWNEESVITDPAAADFDLYQGGVGWHSAMARSQGNFPLKHTGLPSWLLQSCAFFCPPKAAPEKCLYATAWLCAQALHRGLQAWHLSAGCAALLELLLCAVLGWFSSACFQQKSHKCCWVTTVCTVCAVFLCMLLQGAMEQKHRRSLSQNLLTCFRLSVVSQK